MEFQISQDEKEIFYLKVKKTIKPFLYYLGLKKPYEKFVEVELPIYEGDHLGDNEINIHVFNSFAARKKIDQVIKCYKEIQDMPFFKYKGHKFKRVVIRDNLDISMVTAFAGNVKYYYAGVVPRASPYRNIYRDTEKCKQYVDRLKRKKEKKENKIVETVNV